MPGRKLTTDLENRMWLCEQVVEAHREDGLRLERALAMLHRLTDPGRAEPYFADLESGWPDVNIPPVIGKLAEQQLHPLQEGTFDDGLGPLPSAEEVLPMECPAQRPGTPGPLCAICETLLERRPKESYAAFYARETCSKSHAAMLRAQRKRESELVVA